MATLIIHAISDFLRDHPTQQGFFGEAFRCKVLENEVTALQAYGLNGQQIGKLQGRNRDDFLKAISDEIAPVMDEVMSGGNGGLVFTYPAGNVHLAEIQVLVSTGNTRSIMVRGTGFDAGTVVTFTDAGGVSVKGTIRLTTCDPDVWQRLHVDATLAAGTYTVEVKNSKGAQARTQLTIP